MNPSAPKARTILLVSGALVIVALQVVLLQTLEASRIFPKYWQLAADLLEGTLSRDRLNDVSPLYLWGVALIRMIDLSPFAIRLLQFASNAATLALATTIAFRTGGATAGTATFAFLAAGKAMFLNASELEPESLILFLNTLALFFLLGKERTRRNTFVGALAFGLSAVARPVVLPAALLVLAVVLLRDEAQRRVKVSFSALGLALPLLLAMAATWLATGHPSIMNPGTVFYEGMNPHATGYTSTEPLVVSDLRAEVDEPDALHHSYRLIASRAEGVSPSAEASNRFWTGKAIEFMETHPMLAAELTARKTGFALHSFDAWDIGEMVWRDREIDWLPWIPFGVIVAFALVAAIVRWKDPIILALILFCGSYVAVMAIFYVSSRQRNALLSAAAILGGIGLAATVEALKRSRVRGGLYLALILTISVALTVHGPWQRENIYSWTASFRSQVLVHQRHEAVERGDVAEAARLRAIDRTWLLGDDPHIPAAPRDLVASIARGELSRAESPQRLFDLALALQYAGDWDLSDRILVSLEEQGYEPIRRTYAVDSLAWYRALAAMHTGKPAEARAHLERSFEEAPSDPNVLAMQTALGTDDSAREELFRIHDRFTAELAISRAHYELGNLDEAKRIASEVHSAIPEWNRARLLSEYFEDLDSSRESSQAPGR